MIEDFIHGFARRQRQAYPLLPDSPKYHPGRGMSYNHSGPNHPNDEQLHLFVKLTIQYCGSYSMANPRISPHTNLSANY